jgi:hypothetical protein
MSCTPVEIAVGFFTTANWSPVTSIQAQTMGGRTVTTATMPPKLIVESGSSTLEHRRIDGGELYYWFFGVAGNLLILDAKKHTDNGATYTTYTIGVVDPTLVERPLFGPGITVRGQKLPVVQRSSGSGTAFLLYFEDDASNVTHLAIRRSDTGDVLLEGPESFVRTLPINGEFRDSTLFIHCPGGNANGVVSGPLGKLDVIPNAITDFTAAIGGNAAVRDFRLENVGHDCLIVTAIQSQPPAWAATPSQPLPASLAPGDQLTVTVSFQPTADAHYSSTSLSVTRTPAVGDAALACTGRRPVKKIGFDPASLSLDFQTLVGETGQKKFGIRNEGDLEISVDYAASGPGSRFSWQGWTGTIPIGGFHDVWIGFTPQDESQSSANLTIGSDAPGAPHHLALTGKGYQLAPIVHDLYIRDNLQDDGSEPLVGGGISASPDVIVRNAPVTDPRAELGSAAAWQQDTLSNPVEAGQDNYLYLRIQNRGTQAGAGTAIVNWSQPSTLPSPDQWTEIGRIAFAPVAPGEKKVVGPIVWPAAEIPEPVGAIPGRGHYCFVALIESPGEPVPNPGSISTIDEFYRLIREKNNVTWRNFDVVDVLPNTKQAMSIRLGGWPDADIYTDLEVDAQSLPADAVVTLRVPRRVAEHAHRRGLTLVRETKRECTFQVDSRQICALAGIPIRASESHEAVLEVDVPAHMAHGAYRVSLAQKVNGREMGRVSSMLAVGDYPYVGNSKTREIHVPACEWARRTSPRRRIALRSVEQALKQGFNGCRFCLPEHSTD